MVTKVVTGRCERTGLSEGWRIYYLLQLQYCCVSLKHFSDRNRSVLIRFASMPSFISSHLLRNGSLASLNHPFRGSRLTSVDDPLIRQRVGMDGYPPKHRRVQRSIRHTFLGPALHR